MKSALYRALLVGGAVVAAAQFPSVAMAQDAEGSGVKVGITGGTLGIGPEASFRFSEALAVRGNATFFNIDATVDGDDLEYEGEVKLKSAGLMVDIHPFGGGFRITPGIRFNGNKAQAIGIPNSGDTYEIDGETYTAAEVGTLSARTRVKDVAPSLTVGYGGGMGRGVSFGIEAGALFQGSIGIDPIEITGVCATSTSPDCTALRADLEAERQSIEDDISSYKVYPIVQLSLGYRF